MGRTGWAFLAMALGAVVGLAAHALLPHARAVALADAFSLVTRAFVRLIQMVIAPLVFSTLAGAVAKAGARGGLGRLALLSLAWFLVASIAMLLIGTGVALWLRPGAGLDLPTLSPVAAIPAPTAADFVDQLAPTSIVDAMARNAILQIVVFALFAGLAMGRVEAALERLVPLLDAVAAVSLRIVDMVMVFAPAAVFCALAAAMAENGLGLIAGYARFVGGVYLVLLAGWAAILVAAWVFPGHSPARVMRAVRQPLTVAFSTASSAAAYPGALEALEASGVKPRVASLVLPLGYAFNLDGTMLYAPFAVLFLAQAYGVPMSMGQVALMLVMLLAASKGVAAVPRAVLVVIAATLPEFHIPAAGLALLIGIDHPLDMGRSATNVLGNYVAALGVDRFEREA